MKHRFQTIIGSAMLSLGLALPVAAQEFTLRVANWIPNPNHPIAQALEIWADKVETESGGRIAIDVDKASIGKPAGQYDLVRTGVVDIGWGLLSLTPGRFELSQVIELPFLSPDGETGSRMATEVWQKHFSEREFTDTRLLAIHVNGAGHLHTKTPVTEIGDFAGQKIRTVGGGVSWLEALGATPVVLPATQSHEALARGVADGILFPWQAIKAYRLEELVTHHLEVPGGLYTVAFFFAMNPRSYARLPDDLKAVIDANSGPDTAAFFGAAWDEADRIARAEIEANPEHDIIAPSAGMMAEMNRRAEAITATWTALAQSSGIDPEAVLGDMRQ